MPTVLFTQHRLDACIVTSKGEIYAIELFAMNIIPQKLVRTKNKGTEISKMKLK